MLTLVFLRVAYSFMRSKVARIAEFYGRAREGAIVVDVGDGRTIEWPWESLRIHASADDPVVVSNNRTGIIVLARELFDDEEQ